MDQSTLDKLRKLHLKSMAASYETQDSVPGIMDMTFDERLSFLVDAELDSRDNRRLNRRIIVTSIVLRSLLSQRISISISREMSW